MCGSSLLPPAPKVEEHLEDGAKPVSFIDEIVASQAAEQVMRPPLLTEEQQLEDVRSIA